MSFINRDKILNENPLKKLMIGYDKLKENFTEENAYAYMDLYKNQPLSFLLENSPLIFKEPYYGYDFYKNLFFGESELPLFHEYQRQILLLESYLDENKEKMVEKQKEMYGDLLDSLKEKKKEYKNCETISGYLQGEYPSLSDDVPELCDDLYEYPHCKGRDQEEKCQKISQKMQEIPKVVYHLYAPFVNQVTKNPSLIVRSDIDELGGNSPFCKKECKPEFESYIESVFVLSKLFEDEVYHESVRTIPNVSIRSIFTGYAKEPAKEQIDNIITERVYDVETYYSSPKAAVNRIFNDRIDDTIFEEDAREHKEFCLGLQKIAYDKLSDILLYEYMNVDDVNEPVSSYNFFEEGTTIEEAFRFIVEKQIEINMELPYITEEEENDLDKDMDKIEKEIDKKMEERNAKDDKNIQTADEEEYQPKKVDAPKPKNLSNKIQFKAMDAEAKQLKKMGEKEQKGQERANAIKAVSQLPKNIIDNIKKQIKKIDEKDDKRRKKYMTEPGFRKKAFRNLKLSLLYGSVAQMKLALLPVTAVFRHLSKEKDRRIRNELLSQLDTEIKICEEKINDANSEGSKKQKYQLMRIKAKLERERLRVKTNSRYI